MSYSDEAITDNLTSIEQDAEMIKAIRYVLQDHHSNIYFGSPIKNTQYNGINTIFDIDETNMHLMDEINNSNRIENGFNSHENSLEVIQNNENAHDDESNNHAFEESGKFYFN